jgi:hypothetical protein
VFSRTIYATFANPAEWKSRVGTSVHNSLQQRPSVAGRLGIHRPTTNRLPNRSNKFEKGIIPNQNLNKLIQKSIPSSRICKPLPHSLTSPGLANLQKIYSQLPLPFFRTLTQDQHYFRTAPSGTLPVILRALFLTASAVQAILNLLARATIRD